MKRFFFIWLVLLSINSHAQDKFETFGLIGLSDFKFIHPKGMLSPTDDLLINYSFKAGFIYNILNKKPSKIYPATGVTFTWKTARLFHRTYGSLPEFVSKEKYFTFDAPVTLNYQITGWLKINGGFYGSILAMNNAYSYGCNVNRFTYGTLAGASCRFGRYSINLEYTRDINYLLKYRSTDFKAAYRCSLINIGIGYHFSSLKKVKEIIR